MIHPKFFVLKISEKFVHIRGPFSSHELTRTNTKNRIRGFAASVLLNAFLLDSF